MGKQVEYGSIKICIHQRNQPDLGLSLLDSVAVRHRLPARCRGPVQEVVVGDGFALRLVALKAGEENKRVLEKVRPRRAADAGRYPTAEKMVTRRARRRSILITSGPGGIRSAARQIIGLMNKSLTVLSAAKRFLFTTTSGESTSLDVIGCRGEITPLFHTHELLLYSSYTPLCVRVLFYPMHCNLCFSACELVIMATAGVRCVSLLPWS